MKFAATLIVMLSAAHVSARPNACQVLTAADVKAVQGEAHSNAKLSTRGAATQCFYQLPSFVNSISLDLHREGREYWNEHFERKGEGEREERERERERELRVKAKAREEEEEGEKEHPPRRVRGVGDEAFWVGGQMAGSLYVRKGDAVLRVSVGGKGTDDQKIAKTKALAKKALKRL